MKIFVTGASGFVGGAATRALVAAGHKVRAMSRRDQTDTLIRGLGAEPVRCDLENIGAADIGECEVVLHCAAFVEAWGPKDAWYQGNVLGTKAVLTAAREAGAGRFIHIGTEAGIVHGQHILDADESYPLSPGSPYPYCATKAQAETLVRAANTPGFATIVLRPRFIWGPGDTTLLPAIETMAAGGGWMWLDHGAALTSSTHIDNLVHAIELALTQGTAGEVYFILDAGSRSLKQIITGMAASKNLQLGERNIPFWLADLAGRVCEGLWRLLPLKGSPPLTRHAAMVMSRSCVLNGEKARVELAYTPVISYEEGMRSLAG
jgi:nucleoside-diphosphate-sugar epimerase